MVVLVQLYFYNLEAEEALKGKTSALFKSAGMRFSIAALRCSILILPPSPCRSYLKFSSSEISPPHGHGLSSVKLVEQEVSTIPNTTLLKLKSL